MNMIIERQAYVALHVASPGNVAATAEVEDATQVNGGATFLLAAVNAASEFGARSQQLTLAALETELLLVLADPEALAEQEIVDEGLRLVEERARRNLFSAMGRLVSSPEVVESYAARVVSDGEFDNIPGLIGTVEGNLLDTIEGALAEYMKQLQIITDLMAELSKAIDATSDEVTIYGSFATKIANALAALGSSPPLASFSNVADAQAFIDKLGLPNLKISGQAPSFQVRVDVAPLEKMLAGFYYVKPPLDAYVDKPMSNAAFQAWVNGKDAMVEDFQHIAQVLAQDLSRKNQLFTDISGALSKAMDRLLQMLMGFVNGIPG